MPIGIDTISAKHAQIEYRDNSFYLTDLGSMNGTYLNEGKDRITDEIRLKNGDVITFDHHKFKFILPGHEDKWVVSKPIQSSGETILSVPEPPEQPPPEEEREDPPTTENRNEDEEAVELKPLMCPEHPNSEATETCPVCERTLCIHCIVEKDGKRLCERCMEMQFAFERQ